MVHLERELDRLFQQPLATFVPGRNALAAQLKKAGREDEAERVRRLLKPSQTAWLVNQLYWRGREDLDAFLRAADRVRRTQEAALAGRRPRDAQEACAARDRAAQALMDCARAFADEARAPLSAALASRLRTTLDAIGAYGSDAARHAHGRLQEDLDPPGFSAFAALAASVPSSARPAPKAAKAPAKPPPLALVPKAPDPRLLEARQALAEAQERAAAAHDAAAAAASAEQRAIAALEQADARVASLTTALAEAREGKAAAARELRERRAAARKAAGAAEAAAGAVEKAKREVGRRR